MSSNPFVFAIQIAALLLTPAGYEGKGRDVKTNSTYLPGYLGSQVPTAPFYWDKPDLQHHYSATTTLDDVTDFSATTARLWAPPTIKGGDRLQRTTGHGSAAGTMSSNPFVFAIQVSKRFGKCLKSNELCLIVLPCPRLLSNLLCEFCVHVSKLLLIAGDVESNPGPDYDQFSKQLKQISDDIRVIKEERLTSIDLKLDSLSNLDTKVSTCMEQINSLQKALISLELKVDDLENRSRRSNLIVYGLPEEAKENEGSLEHKVHEKILKSVLEVEDVTIERIHRLGRPAAKKTRPVILKLLDYRDKTQILSNCYKLKGSSFSIGEDFSWRVRNIRKKLWNYAKARKESGDKVSLSYDKLRINDDLYRWDDETNDVALIQTHSAISSKKNQEAERQTTRTRRNAPRQK
ncbi:uncharacterized protein [Dermacentor albipictus]|uniref:uncharacterized protein n=1 Tax=Dermacentor albipictus TaxID=60249 RepID=UPI0031FCFD8D